MSDHKITEPFVAAFKWEFTPKHLKQFGGAYPVYMFLKSLCNYKVRPLTAKTQVEQIVAKTGISERTVQRHLSRLKKYNYIFTRQTQRGLFVEIVLDNDKYVTPPSPAKPVTPPPELSPPTAKYVTPDPTELAPHNEETENSNDEKQTGKEPNPAKPVTPPILKDLYLSKIKPDVGLLIWFFQRTYFNFNAKSANLPDDDLQAWAEEIIKYIPSPRLVRCAWLVFLHGWVDDDYLATRPKTLKIFHGQVRNGKFVTEAQEFSEQRRRDGVEKIRTPKSPSPTVRDVAGIAKKHNPEAFAFWEKVKGEIRPEISEDDFNNWFALTYPYAMNGSSITVACPDQYIRGGLISNYRNYRELVESKIREVDENYNQVEFCKHVWGEGCQ